MAGNNFFTDLFDISVREQIALSLCNSASDTFFLLSGPPKFDKLQDILLGSSTTTISAGSVTASSPLSKLCPLLFSTQFADSENKNPDPLLYSLGTANTVVAPASSSVTQKSLYVTASAYVTKDPWALNQKAGTSYLEDGSPAKIDGGKNQRWNMLKRLYFWMLNDSTYANYFPKEPNADGSSTSYIGNEAVYPWAVAPDVNAPWGNFAKSDLYKIPFGIMAVTATKDRIPLKVTYYEGCLLQSLMGAELSAALQTPVTYAGTSGFTASFAKRITFSDKDCLNICGISGDGVLDAGNGGLFSQILEDYLNTSEPDGGQSAGA